MTDMNRIRDALSYVPADDRDTWLRLGMAVKAELGDAGFELWNTWSQRAPSYRAKDAHDVWKSLRTEGKITSATLFHYAKTYGWRDDGTHREATADELAERECTAAEWLASEQNKIARERADTARKATAIWKAATDARPDHPYLLHKRISPVATLREIHATVAAEILGYIPKSGGDALTGRLLVVPVKQGNSLSTIELIDGDKRKTALAGRGSKAGGYWSPESLPESVDTLLIGEGVATVLSAREASNLFAIAALSSTNLAPVAKAMRERYPAANLVMLADLVKSTGKADAHAIRAASMVGAKWAVPSFGTDRHSEMKDFNDMAVLYGSDAVRDAIANPSGCDQNQLPVLPAHESPTVALIRASDLKPEPIAWLWPGWLAAGKLHVFGGAPGTGKTTIAMQLAATVTIGGHWPDGTRAAPGNVVIWSGEDDPQDTLIPRLILSGADLKRAYFISGVCEGGERRSFDPARDLQPLQRKLTGIGGARLLIVDPIVSAITGDSHKNAEVRRGLQPLVDLAASMRCALLGITHFSKGTAGRDPVERLTGSLAFGALARLVLVAAKHQTEDEDENDRTTRLFCRAKSNIGPDDGGFEYDLFQSELPSFPGVFASTCSWGRAIEGSARELLTSAEATNIDSEAGALAEAKQFLSDLLADGPMPVKAIRADADDAGHSWATIRRAQKALCIEAVKEGGHFGPTKQRWVWRRPIAEDVQVERVQHNCLKALESPENAQEQAMNTFQALEHLQQDDGIVEVEI